MQPDNSAPAVSVVVIGRNEGERLVRCLRSIQEMQALADKICKWELRLDETYQILQFLRDEEAAESGESGDSDGATADAPEGSR